MTGHPYENQPPARGDHDRRRFFQGAASVAATLTAAQLATAPAAGATPPRRTPKIDVHSHFLPAEYRQALIDNGESKPDGFPALPEWSVQAHLDVMDQLGIGTSMLSISSPGVTFGANPEAVRWARFVNDAGAELVRQHPRRFGLFANLPLPDLDASLTELERALDTLGADEVALETNYDGIYLGDRRFAPLFQELHLRKAVVLIHPTSPACWEQTALGYPRPLIEFHFDTTRALSDMVLNGTLTRYSDARVIVPHSGSALVPLADRVAALAGVFPLGGNAPGQIDVIGTFEKLYYETGAGNPFPRQFPGLLSLAKIDRLLYGSDWPFGPVPGIQATLDQLERTRLLNPNQRRALYRDNAVRLFPRLQE
ncbi:putative metal-dependent hydrolase, TIM-barrel fold [Prauserella aidingensis]|uniref:amidohydrolase family protein n=1 Tax=Prauserella aidingensis TaxID=387890 RepID=UPI0020A4CE96|nr:amidohydrolase family protein [Prauserella aidingensis]MCP2256006.1 putative metal-dependent hydrolase, TIM-barrel fold [Prauserella aidingensis]